MTESVLIVTEGRVAHSRGVYWGSPSFAHSAWNRYLSVFDRVLIAVRVESMEYPVDGLDSIEVPGKVEVVPLPNSRGLGGLKNVRAIDSSFRRHLATDTSLIIRVPSTLGTVLLPRLRIAKRPYGVEVIGDPFDVFARGVIDHPVRPLLRSWQVAQTRSLCRNAASAVYVTRHRLQSRYPVGVGCVVAASSDVILRESSFMAPRGQLGAPPMVLAVGAMDQKYKGHHLLIEAVSILSNAGMPVRLTLVGDGARRHWLESLVPDYMRALVTFTGQLDAEGVRAQLAAADVFAMPSLTEGLPRALLEAMAAGLPCVGTRVGGIPELLAEDDLVEPGNSQQLASSIERFVIDGSRRLAAATRNVGVAREWWEHSGNESRAASYEFLSKVTKNWSVGR